MIRASAWPLSFAARARARRGLLAAILAALALPACRLDVALDVTLDREGAGRVEVSVRADAELVRRAAGEGVDPLADLVAAGEGLAAHGWTVSDEVGANGSRTVRLGVAVTSPAEVQTVTGQLADALAAPELRPLEPLRVALLEDRITVEGAADLVVDADVPELGLTAEQATAALSDADVVGYAVTVAFPGPVLQATVAIPSPAPSAVAWSVAPGESVTIRATAVRPGPTIVPLVAAASGGAVVAAMALLALLWLRRRQ